MSSQNPIALSDSEDSVRTPEYFPDTPPHSYANSDDSANSSEYKPMSTPEWEAINKLPNYDSDSSNYEPEEEEPMEEIPESPAGVNYSLKRKEPETPAADVAGPSKRASSPFCNNNEHILVKCDLMNLQRSTDKCREAMKRHVARIEMRQDKLEHENQTMSDAKGYQNEKMEKFVKIKMEKERRRADLTTRCINYRQDRLERQLDKYYDNLQYFFEKQEARYAEFKKFEKYVQALLWDMKKGPGPM